MKKRIGVALVIMASAAVAFAGTIQIPFFLDNGSADADPYPTTGTASYISVKNPSTADALTITIRYFDNDGTECTPTANTYTIPAGAAVSWRPWATDTNEGSAGSLVPNKTGTVKNGTAIVTYSGTSAVRGRVAVFSSVEDSYGYLLTSD